MPARSSSTLDGHGRLIRNYRPQVRSSGLADRADPGNSDSPTSLTTSRLNCLVLVGATKPIQHLCRLATFRWIARCTGKGKEAIQRSVRLATRAKVSTNRD